MCAHGRKGGGEGDREAAMQNFDRVSCPRTTSNTRAGPPNCRGEFLAHPIHISIPPAHPISADGCAQIQCRVISNKPRTDFSPVLTLGQTASNMPAWVGPLKCFRREFRMRQAQARLSRQNTTCAVFFTPVPRHPVEQDVGTQDSSMLGRLHAINNMRGSGYGGLVTPSRPR